MGMAQRSWLRLAAILVLPLAAVAVFAMATRWWAWVSFAVFAKPLALAAEEYRGEPQTTLGNMRRDATGEAKLAGSQTIGTSRAAAVVAPGSQGEESSAFGHQRSEVVEKATSVVDKPWDAVGGRSPEGILDMWPLPSNLTMGTDSAVVSPTLTFVGDVADPLVHRAIERYKALIFPHRVSGVRATLGSSSGSPIGSVVVHLAGSGSKEHYELYVNSTGAAIVASSPVGVQYALETLSQLVVFDFGSDLYRTQSVLPLVIKDQPRFPHRGLLLDTSRHFLSVATMCRIIESMSYVKLNKLHWHVIDERSFPLNSRVNKNLALRGAWSSRERYTQEDIAEVVRFAADRGIDVVPEFDMPGHTRAMSAALPELMVHSINFHLDPNNAALNPTKNETYDMVQKLLHDWLVGQDGQPAYFNSSQVHLGADEVPYEAWKWLGDPHQLFEQFLNRVVGIATGMGKEVVLWEEAVADATPPKEAIIQVWANPDLAAKSTQAGYRTLISQGWYLDSLEATWLGFYQRDPLNHIAKDHEGLVIGGEACMWGEKADGGSAEAKIWPRLGAVAERLWSGSHDTTQAEARLASFRCLLLERGVPAGGMYAHVAGDAPAEPGACAKQ